MESNFCKEAYDWLNGNQLSYDIWNKKYRYNNENFEEWLNRVSGGKEHIRNLIKAKKFLFGGRILAGRGVKEVKRTLSNCYVISPPEDTIESIFECGAKLARTFSYGGGCGIDISKLRPNGAKVNNAALTTSGAVSFMDFFSYITGLIGQQGRRGALMISISCEHPDIEEFIQIKKDLNKVTKANISIRMTDKFMQAAKNHQNVTLSFITELGDKIEREVNAYDILMQIAKSNWEMGEPGMLFWDRISSWNLLANNSEFEYAGVNPCAEEPLPAGGSCLLGSLNISEFVDNKNFAEQDFCEAVKIAVRGLNDVLDEGLLKHPLKEQQDSVKDWRQIGLGIFGLADAFIKLHITYGSDESIDFLHYLGNLLINSALEESALLAKEFGAYPKYNDKVIDSEFFKYVANIEVRNLVQKYGLRNSQLLTCAPTGSLATMFNTSGSAEAIFALSYNRKTISLNKEEKIYKVYPKIIQNLIDQGFTEENLPECVVTAHQIPYKKRLEVQATLNKYIDASISSTCNLPESITVKEIADLYLYAWECGCKGVTIWRDNCNREAILTTNLEESKSKDNKPVFDTITPISRKTFGTTYGATHCKKCACGTLYITTNLDKDGNLVEVFTHTSKGGICQANLNAVTRMISLGLRSGIKIEEIEDQLKGIHCPACQMIKAKGNYVDGLSCPDITAKTIKEFVSKGWKVCKNTEKHLEKCEDTEQKPLEKRENKCPECGESIINTGGCISCPNCGYSKCG